MDEVSWQRLKHDLAPDELMILRSILSVPETDLAAEVMGYTDEEVTETVTLVEKALHACFSGSAIPDRVLVAARLQQTDIVTLRAIFDHIIIAHLAHRPYQEFYLHVMLACLRNS